MRGPVLNQRAPRIIHMVRMRVQRHATPRPKRHSIGVVVATILCDGRSLPRPILRTEDPAQVTCPKCKALL